MTLIGGIPGDAERLGVKQVVCWKQSYPFGHTLK